MPRSYCRHRGLTLCSSGRPIELFFPVPSIAEARAKAPALGGKVGPKAKEWEARGIRACAGHDPEGNVVQFRENAP